MGDITENFSYDEFKVSRDYPQVAAAIELTQMDRYKCFWMAHLFLQPIRDMINTGNASSAQISITSGIRRGELNSLVGGVPGSDHLFNRYQCAVDFKIVGEGLQSTSVYYDLIYRLCRRKKEYVKQLIWYMPSAGDFIHLSLHDKTDKVWERLFCVSRGDRRYFHTKMEAEDFLRGLSG